MEQYIGVLRDLKKLRTESLNPEQMFWMGFIAGKTSSNLKNISEKIYQLGSFIESNMLNLTYTTFLILTYLSDQNRYNTLINSFMESLDPYVISNSLSQPEVTSINQIHEILEGIHIEPEIIYKQEPEIQYNESGNYYQYPDLSQIPQSDQDIFDQNWDTIPRVKYAPPPEIECLICLESFSLEEFVPLNTCQCNFHTNCFNKFLELEIQQRKFPLNCPGCKSELHERDIFDRVEEGLRQNYLEFTFGKFVAEHSSEYSCCPTPDCKNVFIAGNEHTFNCNLCGKSYCLRCKVEYHTGRSCEQYQQSVIDKKTQAADVQFMNFVKGTNYKQCPNCRFWVEKSAGCNHMTCRCRYEFCYVCGGRYNHCECVKNARF